MEGRSRERNARVLSEPDPPAADEEAREAAAEPLRRLEALEDALVDRAIAIARENGYAPYTTTIRAAWTEAVRSLTDALVSACGRPREGPSGPQAEIDYRSAAAFARMRAIARKHRALGITLELYLGLFKHFRRVYLDALAALDMPPAQRDRLLSRALDFFDESELSITGDWTGAGGADQLQELQSRTRTLTLAKDRYVAIFESLRNPALLLDKHRRLVHANKAAIDLFLGEGEAGDGLYRHGHHELSTRLEARFADALDPDAEGDPAVWMDTTAGRRCFDVRLRPLHDAVGNIALGHLLQLYDITAYRRATEQAQRAERQMSRFLATMSHEIRTPLHSVLGAAELLRSSDGAADDAYLDVIQNAGQSLLLTLNNVLDFTKLEHGPPVPRPSDTEIRPALAAVCAMAAVGPGAHQSEASLEVDPDVPERVRLDWAMTRQVLTNLLSNAMRHDDGSGVRLRATLAPGDPAARTLRFEVSDHGPGFPPGAASALDRPFDQTKARHTGAGGTGLGLAISGSLVRAMAGRIGLDTPEAGARIWFDLPFDLARMAAAEVHDAAASGRPAGGRCLLVDDDPVGALVSGHQLARLGFAVDRAATLAEAAAALACRAYDAVVVDYLLPDGIGPDLFGAMEGGRKAPGTRFVALSANVEALNACEEIRACFDAVLAKPTDVATLARTLNGSGRPAAPRGPAAPPAPNRLEGLSDATVAAMTAAFRPQWAEFRARLEDLRRGAPVDGLGDLAHRLAGTTAQLGLTEFEAPLRDLERRCRAGGGDCSDLVAALDRPLEDAPSWRGLPAGGTLR